MILVGDYAPGNKPARVRGLSGLVLANLEGPIVHPTSIARPVPKAGPSLANRTLPKGDNCWAFCLANNHVMDFGLKGLSNTICKLKEAGYSFAGAGADCSQAQQPIIVEDGDAHVGLICCCEAQFGVATSSQPGTASLGPWIYEAIRKLEQECDTVVVSVHAGFEMSPWPAPQVQDLYRSLIDAGARIVHGHHPHVPQGVEAYRDGLIVYGAGNFLVDPDQWRSEPNTLWSLGVEVEPLSSPVEYRILTFEIHIAADGSLLAEPSSADESARHADYLEAAGRPLSNRALLEALWQQVSLRSFGSFYRDYLQFAGAPARNLTLWQRLRIAMQSAHSFTEAIVGKKNPLQPTRDHYLLWYHLFACLTHHDAIATALGILSGEIERVRTEESRSLADGFLGVSADRAAA